MCLTRIAARRASRCASEKQSAVAIGGEAKGQREPPRLDRAVDDHRSSLLSVELSRSSEDTFDDREITRTCVQNKVKWSPTIELDFDKDPVVDQLEG